MRRGHTLDGCFEEVESAIHAERCDIAGDRRSRCTFVDDHQSPCFFQGFENGFLIQRLKRAQINDVAFDAIFLGELFCGFLADRYSSAETDQRSIATFPNSVRFAKL